METTEHCKFEDAEGFCQNPELNTEGSKCCNCEDFVSKRIDQSCRDCKYFDPENGGGYCYHYSVPQSAIGHPCKYFEQGVCVTMTKAKKETGKREQTLDELTVSPEETRWILISEIEPHPDALAFWGDDENENENDPANQDTGALKNSVARFGNVTAALVVRKEDDSGWWLLDGCGRLAGAVKGGRNDLYCTILDVAPEFYTKLMMEVNMNRRRVATGSRVLRYLELYQNEVLAEVDRNADPRKTGAMGGRGNKGSTNGTPFSLEAIRERLHCSKSDVSAGILYLRCKRDDAVPYKEDSNGPWLLRNATDDEIKRREAFIARVRAGATPLRTWGGGFIGSEKTKGKSRPKTDYASLAVRTFASLRTVFAGWQEIGFADRGEIVDLFAAALETAPEDVDEVLMQMYAEPRKSK